MVRYGDYFDEERRRLLSAEDTPNRRRGSRGATPASKTGEDAGDAAPPEQSNSSSGSSSSLPPSPTRHAGKARTGVVRTHHGIRQPRALNGRTSDYGSGSSSNGGGERYPSSSDGHYFPGRSRSEGQLSSLPSPPNSHSYAGGFPQYAANTTGWQTRLGLYAILSAVLLERVCFYALTGNLVLFLNKNPFLWESYHAMNALFLFLGVTYVMSFVGGWVADSLLGRFRTMVLCYLVYVAGYAVMPFLAQESDRSLWNRSRGAENNETQLPFICGGGSPHAVSPSNPFADSCAWLVYLTLVVIAMGSGALRANMCPFGSDQLPRASQNTQLSFFNWYYWCINCGSFIGMGVMAYVEQQCSFRLAYMICASILFSSGLVFCIGRLCYTSRTPDGSVLTNVFKILREAFKRWRQRRQMERARLPPSMVATEDSASTSPLVKAGSSQRHGRPIPFLDYAKHQHGGVFHSSLVDDVKKLGMIITVFAVLIPYWIVYFQMQTTFLFQGLHMRLDFYPKHDGPDSLPFANLTPASPPHHHIHHYHNTTQPGERPQIVAAWFNLFDAVFVIIMLPLFDRIIYPALNRAGHPITFTVRIVVGMVFAMAAVVVAGVVEHYRLKAFWPHPDEPCVNASIPQYIAGTKYDAADMSVFWQIPQFALIGMSEVFTSVACLQFAVSVAPKSMKALITGIFYCFCGVGSFLGTSILASLAASKTWIYSHNYGNINCRLPCNQVNPPVWKYSCHLDYYFFSLAGLAGLTIILFLIVARVYGLGSDRLVINAQGRVNVEEEGGRRRLRNVQVLSASGSAENQLSS